MNIVLKWKQQANQGQKVILLLQASQNLRANPEADQEQEIQVAGKGQTAGVEGQGVMEDQEVEAEHALDPEVDHALQEGMEVMTDTDSMWQVRNFTNLVPVEL